MKNELQVKIDQKVGKIDFNYEEMKAELEKTMSEYTDIVVTEDTTKIAKKDVAELRKLKTSLNDRRIEVKKEYDKPYDSFKSKVDELIELIDEPINLIDKQVKEFEKKEKEEKKKKIKEIYTEEIGEIKEYLSLEQIYNAKWENKGTTLKSIREEIESVVSSTKMAIDTIKGMKSEVENKALDLFKSDLSLANAITYINKHEQLKAEILAKEEEKRKEEEERKRQVEIERIKEEERKKIQEIEKAREEARQQAIEEHKAVEDAREEVEEIPFLADTEEPLNIFDQLPTIEEPLTIDEPTGSMTTFTVFGEEKDFNKIETYLKFIGIEYRREDA